MVRSYDICSADVNGNAPSLCSQAPPCPKCRVPVQSQHRGWVVLITNFEWWSFQSKTCLHKPLKRSIEDGTVSRQIKEEYAEDETIKISIPSFDENNILSISHVVSSIIDIHQKGDIHNCDRKLFVLVLPLPTNPSRPALPCENGNYLLLVFIALKTSRNMSTSIKHKYIWKIPCREPLNAFIIHCWCWCHKWC